MMILASERNSGSSSSLAIPLKQEGMIMPGKITITTPTRNRSQIHFGGKKHEFMTKTPKKWIS